MLTLRASLAISKTPGGPVAGVRRRCAVRTSHIMADIFFLVVTIASFLALVAFVYACERV
jgi:hypothetical protein